MEVNTTRRSAGLKEKIPDIQKTLDMVRFLKTRKVGTSGFYIGLLISELARV
jgi:hypothetical protein